MIRTALLAGLALLALTSSASASELLIPLIIGGLTPLVGEAAATLAAPVLGSIAIGAITVSTSRTLLVLDDER